MWFDIFHGFLTAFDTSTAASWRDEDRNWFSQDRSWRFQDLSWREAEFSNKAASVSFSGEKVKWRKEDITQRNLDNSKKLWLRYLDKNLRDVEEKTTNLKAVSNIAAVFAGFSVVSLTQLNIVYPGPPLGLLALYAIASALTACFMTISLVASTLLLCCILKNGKTYVDEDSEEKFIQDCLTFASVFKPGDQTPKPRKSFEMFWDVRCEPTWQLSLFCFGWGVAAFLISLGPIGWIVFMNSSLATDIWLVALGFVILLWLYAQLRKISSRRAASGAQESAHGRRRSMGGLPFDWHRRPR